MTRRRRCCMECCRRSFPGTSTLLFRRELGITTYSFQQDSRPRSNYYSTNLYKCFVTINNGNGEILTLIIKIIRAD